MIVISCLGIYPVEMKIGSWRDVCITVFTAALFTITRHGHISVHWQTDTEAVVCVNSEVLFSYEREGSL